MISKTVLSSSARSWQTGLIVMGRALRVLNVIDALSTMWLVSRGAEEANPVAAALLSASPLLFLFAKVLMVGLGAEVLTRLGAYRALGFATGVYLAVVLMNLAAIFSL